MFRQKLSRTARPRREVGLHKRCVVNQSASGKMAKNIVAVVPMRPARNAAASWLMGYAGVGDGSPVSMCQMWYAA